jgi:hypothetical protein
MCACRDAAEDWLQQAAHDTAHETRSRRLCGAYTDLPQTRVCVELTLQGPLSSASRLQAPGRTWAFARDRSRPHQSMRRLASGLPVVLDTSSCLCDAALVAARALYLYYHSSAPLPFKAALLDLLGLFGPVANSKPTLAAATPARTFTSLFVQVHVLQTGT